MSPHKNRMLAVAPVHRGLGYVVVDTGGNLIDWGVKEIREKAPQKNARCVVEVENLIELNGPVSLVIEDHNAPGSRKRDRTKELLDLLAEHAIDSGMGVVKFGPRALRLALGLSPTTNKLSLAQEVARRLPVLKSRAPTKKRIWQQEDYSMPIFVAAALALAHLSRAQRGVLDR